MDDVVAVEVQLVRGDVGYVITCVRIQHTVDPAPLDGAWLEQSRHLGTGATTKRAWWPLASAGGRLGLRSALLRMSARASMPTPPLPA
jgi:hypothetical protein